MEPKRDRSCTDILCFLIFLIFTGGTFYVAHYSFTNGNPQRLATPYDPDHKPCGVDERKDFPLIYFVSPSPTTLWRTVCVKQCPISDKSTLECFPNSVVKECKQVISTDSEKQVLVYVSKPFGDKVCIPNADNYYQAISKSLNTQKIQEVASDLQYSKNLILYAVGIAIVLGFVFLLMIRIFATSLIYGFIVLIVSGFVGIGLKFMQMSQSGETIHNSVKPEYYKYIALGMFGIGAALAAIFCCLRSKIALAIATLKVATRFIFDNFSIFFIPIGMVFACLGYFLYWLAVAVYLYSCGKISQEPKSLPFGQFQFDEEMQKFGYIHIFGLLWNMAMIVACSQFISGGVASLWFCLRNNKGSHDELANSNYVLTSISWLIKYHLGSVAFGSLLVAILDSIRLVLAYIDRQQKELAGKEGNTLVNILLKCCFCCISCFECFVKYINKNAYIFIFMENESFFTSCKNSLTTVLSNPATMGLVAGFGQVFEILGSLCISVTSTYISYIILQKTPEFSENIVNVEVPLILIFMISLTIGSYFMGLFGNSADSLILLYIISQSKQNKNALQIPEELTEFVQIYNESEKK